MGHKTRLLNYLEAHGSITSTEAINYLGNQRLSEYIRQLRSEGYVITNEHLIGENRYGEKTRFDRYRFGGRNETIRESMQDDDRNREMSRM